MASYTVKRCPHCFYRLGTSRQLITIKYESPLKTCPKCHKQYIDKDCKELGLYDKLPIFAKTPMSIENLVSMVIVLLISCVFLDSGAAYVGKILMALDAAWITMSFVLWPQRKKKMEEELKKSIHRLSNPSYAMTLRSAGLKVPEEYINPEKHRMIMQNEDSEKSCCERCGIHLREEQFKKLDEKIYCNSCYNITLQEKRIGEK